MATKMSSQIVTEVPEVLDPGTLYVSFEYATAAHLCACGCGHEVFNPLTPTDWAVSFNGTFSLKPSVGNWNFPCQSHYWILNQEIVWSDAWTPEEIARNREHDKRTKDRFYDEAIYVSLPTKSETPPQPSKRRWWSFWHLFRDKRRD